MSDRTVSDLSAQPTFSGPSGPALDAALFPPDLPRPSDWERRYPPRHLPPGAEVTRFAPSPTGKLHIGGLYTAAVSRALAHQSDGVHLLRVEDTDQARLVEGAAQSFVHLLEAFGLGPDEGGAELGDGGTEPAGGGTEPAGAGTELAAGDSVADGEATDPADGRWGPYLQSRRRTVYLSYIADLVRRGLAYPCFCGKDALARHAEEQRASRSPLGYYGKWAPCRVLDPGTAAARAGAGEPYVIRFRCPDEFPGRIRFQDRIRGSMVMQDNGNDVVLLKSSELVRPLPTYHLSHVVDDHLMRVTLVVRGEEWLPSTPLHLQLHRALGFEPPQYAHLAPLMKAEGSSRRKLSKRKDPEASVGYYLSAGYPPAAVQHYLRGLANARLMDGPTALVLAAQVRIEEMRPTGPLLDLPKLQSISREFIAGLATGELLGQLTRWAAEYDEELHAALREDPELARRAVAVAQDRGGGPARKDLARWSDFREKYGFFFPRFLGPAPAPGDERFGPLPADLTRRVAADFAHHYRHEDDPAAWLAQLRDLALRHGFAPDTPTWRRTPAAYAGPPRHVANVVRVCLTGSSRSPDLFTVAHALGEAEVRRRLVLGE
ncbi:glutamate--tRNA ligase [Actinacidiphila acididurans]|uniref:glutamate--tRNA ligase n=1 Tax=Actinacidiphila acididurans TaxID=2784346 RepID=UPI0027DD6175|nr:glutamate--tRNA ligase family protein [Actinacidiphila acididurans]